MGHAAAISDSLSLFTELADLQIPMALVLNFKDDLEKTQTFIDSQKLEEAIGCPVLLLDSTKGEGKEEIQSLLESGGFQIPHAFCRSMYTERREDDLVNRYRSWLSKPSYSELSLNRIEEDQNQRHRLVARIVEEVRMISDKGVHLMDRTKKQDKWLLHPFWVS